MQWHFKAIVVSSLAARQTIDDVLSIKLREINNCDEQCLVAHTLNKNSEKADISAMPNIVTCPPVNGSSLSPEATAALTTIVAPTEVELPTEGKLNELSPADEEIEGSSSGNQNAGGGPAGVKRRGILPSLS